MWLRAGAATSPKTTHTDSAGAGALPVTEQSGAHPGDGRLPGVGRARVEINRRRRAQAANLHRDFENKGEPPSAGTQTRHESAYVKRTTGRSSRTNRMHGSATKPSDGDHDLVSRCQNMLRTHQHLLYNNFTTRPGPCRKPLSGCKLRRNSS